jgi:NTP pyrophosphatase (non-canonical NTP hydrolase)
MSSKKKTDIATRKKLIEWQLPLVQNAASMNMAQYKAWCASIWNGEKKAYGDRDDYIMGMGLSGEVGEVQELLKKAVRDKKDITKVNKKKLVKELGDVLYYWMIICDRHGIDPQTVIDANVKKLTARYKNRR